MGVLNVFGLILIPFGFSIPSPKTIWLGLAGGALDMIATRFYYKALKSGEASETLAVMGGFSPTATALIAVPLLGSPFGNGESVFGFALMTLGGFAMFASEHMNYRQILSVAIAASATFGIANVVQKLVFNGVNFVTGYVLFATGSFIFAGILLLRSSWRKQIFENSGDARPRNKFGYIANRVVSGIGAFLVFLAIKHASPAVVDAIAGIRYVIVFLGALLLTKFKPSWLKEDFTPRAVVGKLAATGLVIAGLVLTGFGGGSKTGGAGGHQAGILLKPRAGRLPRLPAPLPPTAAIPHLR